jgi:hypothetical protein
MTLISLIVIAQEEAFNLQFVWNLVHFSYLLSLFYSLT